MQRDIVVPLEYVRRVFAEEWRVELGLTDGDMDGSDWKCPPLTGT